MSPGKKLIVLAPVFLLCNTSGEALASNNGRAAAEFDVATIIVERNATDDDTEIVLVAKPDSDLGLIKFSVRAPDGRKVAEAKSPRSGGGLREFAFESPEPPGNAILTSYPEGQYRFDGKTSDGQKFAGTANLSHAMPMVPTILYPTQDASIVTDHLTIRWSAVPDAAEFHIEFENESVEPEQVLTLNVPAHITSFEVPTSLLARGAQYQVGIAAVGSNGNIVSVEVQFSIAK